MNQCVFCGQQIIGLHTCASPILKTIEPLPPYDDRDVKIRELELQLSAMTRERDHCAAEGDRLNRLVNGLQNDCMPFIEEHRKRFGAQSPDGCPCALCVGYRHASEKRKDEAAPDSCKCGHGPLSHDWRVNWCRECYCTRFVLQG